MKRESGESQPWTDDPILSSHFFTNVYRELDRGTKFYTEEVIGTRYGNGEVSLLDLIFNTLVYRLFNRIGTYNELGFVPYGRWHFSNTVPKLQEYERGGHKVFTDAFTVTGVKFGEFPDKLSNICYLIDQLQDLIPSYTRELVRTRDLRSIFEATLLLPGFGAFLAYEITIDLNYWFSRYSEDSFVNIGPGCKEGLTYIWGKQKGSFYLEALKYLRYNQEEWFREFGLVFPYYDNKQLSLRNIEHSLCEASKYMRTKLSRDALGNPTKTTTRRFRGPGGREAGVVLPKRG